MSIEENELLSGCLYFTANALARVITKMADDAFSSTGLSPSHAFVLMLVIEEPGANQKRLAEALQLAPSTITRFLDTLAHRGLLRRRSEGRATRIEATEAGLVLKDPIHAAWKRLHESYAAVLGRAEGDALTAEIGRASAALEAKK